jgi:hypothetical protein
MKIWPFKKKSRTFYVLKLTIGDKTYLEQELEEFKMCAEFSGGSLVHHLIVKHANTPIQLTIIGPNYHGI